MIILLVFFLNQNLWAKNIDTAIAPARSLLQNQIKDCNLQLENLIDVKNLNQLYSQIQKKYLIVSEKTIYRELYYKLKNENLKIKVTNDVLELFKIDDEDRHTPINIDARQKLKIVQAQINQLTLNAKIDKDWQKTLEVRENGLKIEIVRVDQKITQLKVSSNKISKSLECQTVNASEICFCNK